jgi:hypothetical protein
MKRGNRLTEEEFIEAARKVRNLRHRRLEIMTDIRFHYHELRAGWHNLSQLDLELDAAERDLLSPRQKPINYVSLLPSDLIPEEEEFDTVESAPREQQST